MKKNQATTNKNYLAVWRHFNRFIVRLDKPRGNWEQHTILFCTHLIENGLKSTTVRSYISAIKSMLQDDNYDWNENQVLLTMLT